MRLAVSGNVLETATDGRFVRFVQVRGIGRWQCRYYLLARVELATMMASAPWTMTVPVRASDWGLYCVSGIGCWMLDARYWVLGAGCRVLGA